MFQAILSFILFEHIFEVLITFIQLLPFQKVVLHRKTRSFVSRISIMIFKKWCYMERQGLLSLESWLWFPCNSFVVCKYRPYVMFPFVTYQHRVKSHIIMFQAILSFILFEHIFEALITYIQLLPFQKVVLHGKTMSFISRISIMISM